MFKGILVGTYIKIYVSLVVYLFHCSNWIQEPSLLWSYRCWNTACAISAYHH